MAPFWNNPTKHIAQLLSLGLVSPPQELARPRPESDRKITSIDQLGSIWQWESHLTWLVPKFLAEGSVNLISSASGTGKTWLAYFLAGAVAHGRTVFGEQVRQRKVLYLDGENPAYAVKQRLYDLGIPETPELTVWGGWHPDPPPGPGRAIIQDFAKREKPLLIWDSLVEFHTGDEQSSTATRKFMKEFRQLANLGATVVILHHTGKSASSQDYRGSSDIEAAVDMAFKLEAYGSEKATLDELTLTPFKCRLVPVPTRLLKYIQRRGFDSVLLAKSADNQPDPLDVIKRIVETTPGLKQSEIVKRAKGEEIAKHKVEAVLERSDIFRSESGKGHTKLYHLVEPSASDRWEGQPV